jgi:hypothetical protein
VRVRVQQGRLLGLTLSGLLASTAVIEAREAVVVSIQTADLVEYETLGDPVKKLIEVSLGFTTRKLAYRFGSNSPEKRGMDCSGTVQCTLRELGFEELPRSSWDFYQWAKAAGELVSTPGVTSTEDPVFAKLKPGDLLFWEGTYDSGERDPPISHVMIFLGTLKADGKGVMFGASSGRRYRGKTIHGVSVFDWEVPQEDSDSKFVAYGPIPGLRSGRGEDPPVKANVLKSVLEILFRKSESSPP